MKNYLVIALIALLGSAFMHFRQYRDKEEAQNRLEALAKLSTKQTTIIRRYIAPTDSTQHVVYKSVFVRSNAEKQISTSGFVDSLSKALDVKICQIEELKRVRAKIADTVKTFVYLNPQGKQQYSYNNKWLDVNVNTADSTLTYNYEVELVDTKYTKGILFWRKTYEDIHLADPHARISNIQGFRSEKEKRRFGLGLSLGYSYAGDRLRPSVGVGLNYNLISF